MAETFNFDEENDYIEVDEKDFTVLPDDIQFSISLPYGYLLEDLESMRNGNKLYACI